ncbi:hypothetical protein QQ020_35845 [Fulvivirgaceae bacterium BMA12]|uniref:Uncharacterized protein n=1 Tax=Agaribacillus aureus TaxID=3051825 RepID=A0ABT8LK05_9BACT|nr:hypothetical protein [Fulvivirgaceae bacterium BMA12]
MDTDNFIDTYNNQLESKNISRKFSPSAYIDAWSAFVHLCIEGYDSSIYEFDYDVQIRDEIEKVLNIKDIQKYDEYKDFREKIQNLDRKLKSILVFDIQKNESSEQWWKKGRLAYAGREYAETLEIEFGLKIKIV